MKLFYAPFLIALFSVCTVQAQKTILWLGNSYTSTSNLPGTFKSLAESGGHSTIIDSYTPGGKHYFQHYEDATSKAKIASRDWDFVVMQQQSQMPYIYPDQTTRFANRIVRDLIKPSETGTEPVIYMTWGRQAGNSWLTATGLSYQEMSDAYVSYYTGLLETLPARMSPVGLAFNIATNAGVNVYSGDGSHQNSTGTYLAACVFYATFYNESPVGLSYTTLSDPDLTLQLQQIAEEVVLPDSLKWNIVRPWMPETRLAENGFLNVLPVVEPQCKPATVNIANNPVGISQLKIGNEAFYTSGSIGEDLYTYGLTRDGYVDNRYLKGFHFKVDSAYNIQVLPTNTEDVVAYIDFNGNGIFEESEKVFEHEDITDWSSADFSIPHDAVTNTLLTFRVISDFHNVGLGDACTSPTFGQVEDFGIWIEKVTSEVLRVEAEMASNTIQYYPNPVRETLNLRTVYNQIYIYSTLGELVATEERGDKVDVSNLKSGVYIIRAEGLTTKFVKK